MKEIIRRIESLTSYSIYFHSAETKYSKDVEIEEIYLEFEVEKTDIYLLQQCRSMVNCFDCHIFNNGMMLFRIMIQRNKEYPF